MLGFLMVFFIISCQKETDITDIINPSETNNPEAQLRTDRKGNTFKLVDMTSNGPKKVRGVTITYEDKEANPRGTEPCNNSEFSIRYCIALPGGGIELTENFCFSSQGLAESLSDAGLSQDEIDQLLDGVFDTATTPTSELLLTIGGFLAPVLDLPPNVIEDCYRTTLNPEDFPSDPGSTSDDGCDPGQIDDFLMYQTQAADGNIIGTQSQQDVLIENTCDGTSFNLDLSVGIIFDALVASGLSPDMANQQISDLASGLLTPRDFFDLIQFEIVPNHPDLPNFTYEDLCCIRITRVIYGLFTNPIEVGTLFRIDGSGQIGCLTNPFENNTCFCICEARDNYGDGEIYLEEIEVDCDACEQDCSVLVPDWWDEYLEDRTECTFEVR